MSQRLTRKEIKHDEFAEVMGRSVEYAGAHSRGLIYAAAGAVAVGGVPGGVDVVVGAVVGAGSVGGSPRAGPCGGSPG